MGDRLTALEIIVVTDERTLVSIVMQLTGGSVNPAAVREQIRWIKDMEDQGQVSDEDIDAMRADAKALCDRVERAFGPQPDKSLDISSQ